MIYLAFALFVEAKPFIKKYSLTKDTSFTKAQVFRGETITAIITGTGAINSEIALTYALALLNPQKNDIFANYGICGCNKDIGKTFLINSLYDTVNEKYYYPDIVYANDFEEASLSSYTKPVKNPVGLCDTEGAFLYKSAQLFFRQHRIFVFKTVSDSGNEISKEYIESLMRTDLIYSFLNSLPNEYSSALSEREIALAEDFCKKANFTTAMTSQLIKIMKYKRLSENFDVVDFIENNPVSDKKGGKRLIEQLTKSI